MKRENDKVLAGQIGYTARSSCMPGGVPGIMMYAVFEDIEFLQTEKQVIMIFTGDEQVRHIYLKRAAFGEVAGLSVLPTWEPIDSTLGSRRIRCVEIPTHYVALRFPKVNYALLLH
jgi:hypothetical protein